MSVGARVLVVGVDGLDRNVIDSLGPSLLPKLSALVAGREPHSATFPPDSVPSWTSIFTGLEPKAHGQLHSINYLIDDEPSGANLDGWHDDCFWTAAPPTSRLAVLNPFLAWPPWAPNEHSAMVSGPSFGEGAGVVADPSGALAGDAPPRMGGFSRVPGQRDIEKFAEETFAIAQGQFEYALRQLQHRRWDLLFHTNLTVDRIQHFAWRHYDSSDPTHPGSQHSWLIPAAYEQLDHFIAEASALCETTVLISDHGHGRRSSIGVNLNELLRREGLYLLDSSPARRAVETLKTAAMFGAAFCHVEEPAIWLARRMPGKASLKMGAVAGTARSGSAKLSNVAGSNPFGGIRTGGDDRLSDQVIELLSSLEHHGKKVVAWCGPAEEQLGDGALQAFPEILFEMHPDYAPTWNLFGPIYAPIVTHKILSGGHTRSAAFGASEWVRGATDSVDIHHVLRDLCARL